MSLKNSVNYQPAVYTVAHEGIGCLCVCFILLQYYVLFHEHIRGPIMEGNEDLLDMNLAELKRLASFYSIDSSGNEADLILRLQQFLSSEDFDDTFYSLSAPAYVAQQKRNSGEIGEKVFRRIRKRTVSDSSIRSHRRNSLDGVTDYTGPILVTKVSWNFILNNSYFI